MAALIAALWAYDGWNDLNMVSGEIRNPGRAIPIALIVGVAVVAALYMLTNAAVQYVLPAAAIAASQRPASEATAIAVGVWGAAIVSAGMALSILVSLNGTIMSGARVPFAMARDGYFFKAMADVHPRFHTPSVALIVQLVAVDRAAAVRGKLPAAVLARDLRGVAVLHGVGEYGVRSAPERARRAAALSPRGDIRWCRRCSSRLQRCCCITRSRRTLRNSAWGVVVILAGAPVYGYFARRKQLATSN